MSIILYVEYKFKSDLKSINYIKSNFYSNYNT